MHAIRIHDWKRQTVQKSTKLEMRASILSQIQKELACCISFRKIYLKYVDMKCLKSTCYYLNLEEKKMLKFSNCLSMHWEILFRELLLEIFSNSYDI